MGALGAARASRATPEKRAECAGRKPCAGESPSVLYKIEYMATSKVGDPAFALIFTPLSDASHTRQRSLHPRHYLGWQNISPQRLGGAFGGCHEPVQAWRGLSGQPFELFAVVYPNHHGGHQMCGGQPRIGRMRAHGVGFCPELCQRQPIAGGRGVLAARSTCRLLSSGPAPCDDSCTATVMAVAMDGRPCALQRTP